MSWGFLFTTYFMYFRSENKCLYIYLLNNGGGREQSEQYCRNYIDVEQHLVRQYSLLQMWNAWEFSVSCLPDNLMTIYSTFRKDITEPRSALQHALLQPWPRVDPIKKGIYGQLLLVLQMQETSLFCYLAE